MKTKLVLCWLTVVTLLVAGCTTGKNREMRGVVTVGKTHVIREFILPEQQKEALPFLVRRAKYSESFGNEDLLPAVAVSEYLETIATTDRLPLRVKEGFLMEKKGRWYLAEWPSDKVYKPPCVGYPVYYIACKKKGTR